MRSEARQALRCPDAVRWIARTLEEAGYDTWAVGGAVRDALAGRSPGDWDLATRARPEEVRRLFRRTVPIGIEHGTVGVLARDGTLYEVTTFRKDVETTGRHAVVEFADTLEEDLSRRDFTINSVAWHPIRGELLDPYGGRGDLSAGLLRTVGDAADRFREDHLRILRGIRFAGDFGLRVEEGTWAAASAGAGSLERLSSERIREEIWKILAGTDRPSRSLSLYAALGALDVLLPELAAVVRAESGGGERAWSDGVLVADLLPRHRPDLRLAAVLQGVGGPEEEAPRADGNEARGASPPVSSTVPRPGGTASEAARAHRRSAAVLVRLRFSNHDVERVSGLVAGGLLPPDPQASAADLRRWLSRSGAGVLRDRARLWLARERMDRLRGRAVERPAVPMIRRLRRLLADGPPLSVRDLAVDGRDLIRMGLRPGPRFGEILDTLLERVLEDPSLNREARLRELVEKEFAAGERKDGGGR